jgi:hypothetical protein
MPKKKGVRITVLVEDEALERFACNVLAMFGVDRRKTYVDPYPVGRNAKQWVAQQYPGKVQLFRRKAGEQVALLVGTDADEQTVQQRGNALAAALDQARLPRRADDERIALWIPKWHVETWILALLGQDVNENENYRHAAQGANVSEAAKGFVDRFHSFKQDAASAPLPSLRTAFEETQRLGV